LVLALIGAAAYGGVALAADPHLALDDVSVEGARRVVAVDIIAAAALPHGRNVWLLDTNSASRAVERLPWIASAKVSRAWPNVVTIVVSERVPIARVALGRSNFELVDVDGRALGPASDATDQALPALTVAPLPPDAGTAGAQLGATVVGQSLDAIRQLTALGVHMTEIRDEPVMGLRAFTQGGLWVVFGDLDDLSHKVALYEAISKRISQPSAVEYIDVRSTAAPTVQYR
jgi:cell division protein FtsQ